MELAGTFPRRARRRILDRRAGASWFGHRFDQMCAPRLGIASRVINRDLHHRAAAGLVFPALLSTLASAFGDRRRLDCRFTKANFAATLRLVVLWAGRSLLRCLNHDGDTVLSRSGEIVVDAKIRRH